MSRDVVVLFATADGQALIKRHCDRIGLPMADLQLLVEEIIDKDSLLRRHGLWKRFDEILESSLGEAEEAADAPEIDRSA